jgi:hypothetical protein
MIARQPARARVRPPPAGGAATSGRAFGRRLRVRPPPAAGVATSGRAFGPKAREHYLRVSFHVQLTDAPSITSVVEPLMVSPIGMLPLL